MLTDAQVERFSRHILLREIGGAGQERLLGAHVSLPRLDEAGRACALWLVRAGVGRLGLPEVVAPFDGVDPSGLLEAADAGRPLTEAVRARLGFHGEVAFAPGGRAVEPGGSVEAGARAALEAVRALVRGEA
jgi:adenylyltransferase/sulfurtransferase